jgi:predicted nuclease of predicted toxin-antitoxin system
VILWIDAQLSPSLAPWIAKHFEIEAFSIKYLGYHNAADRQIFHAARDAGAVVMTKDGDFLRLLEQHGPPPQVLWVTLGNTSNARMKEVLERTFKRAAALLASGEDLVELGEMQQ